VWLLVGVLTVLGVFCFLLFSVACLVLHACWVCLIPPFKFRLCRSLLFSPCIISNIGLWVSMHASFICIPFFSSYIYIQYLSSVFRCLPFLCVFKAFIVSVILPYVCSVFNMCFEYPELLLLFLIACMCFVYLVLNVRPVCPMYFNGQSMHLIW
jgi:hypothetical protein